MDTDDQETIKPKSSGIMCIEVMLITLLLIPIAIASINFLSRSVVNHFPLLPDVAVGSTSASSISRLSATAASAEGLLVIILVRNNNTRTLYFSHVRIVSPAGAAQTSPFAVESSRSAIVWFWLENATVLMDTTGIPSLQVGFEARVRFGGQEISMASKCFPAKISFNLNINSNLTNYGSDDMNIGDSAAAQILKSGGCESKGLWSKNIVKMRVALCLGLLVLVAFTLLLLVVSAWVMAKLRLIMKTIITKTLLRHCLIS